MPSTNDDEAKRTSPLALWRYAHDYLRAAQGLCHQHRIACRESQAPYHVATEGLGFAIKAFLRARGATMTELDRVIGHSLTEALIRGEAAGLPPIPQRWRAAVAEVAACCHENRLSILSPPSRSYVQPSWRPRLDPDLLPDVAAHYVLHLASAVPPRKSS
jgi:hypothetical protein